MQRAYLEHSLIVSCQPVPGGPMDNAASVVGFALAALGSGASAVRVESVDYVRAVRRATQAPIIGIVKRDLSDSSVRITPWISDAEALAEAGADIVAFDATQRERPVSVKSLTDAVKAKGKLTMADCSSLEDAREALACGVDFVGTTLSGYVGGPEPSDPDLALISAMRGLTPFVIAEGRIRTTDQAAAAIEAGAFAVVVGSAITRTEHVTSWFKQSVGAAHFQGPAGGEGVLAIDIGGSKTLAAIVNGSKASDAITIATRRNEGPDQWLAEIADRVAPWQGRFRRVALAVTGIIDQGRWSALNTATLGIPAGYPLVETVQAAFSVPVFAANDAQAAAWGEHKFGAGGGEDMVFLTISTGIGGGVVVNGRPMLGLAGHFGIIRGPAGGAKPFEDIVSGRWIAAEALRLGYAFEAPAVFAAAASGEQWARDIVRVSASRVAMLCNDIQLMFDPRRIVIGGGIGLATGYLDLVRSEILQPNERLRPKLVAAKLGSQAGIIGVADLATTETPSVLTRRSAG